MTVKAYKGITPSFDNSVFIDDSAVIVGEVSLGANCSIWPLVAVRGDVNHIQIGENTNVQDGSVLHVTRKSKKFPDGYPLIIGKDVTVGHKCMLHGCIIGNRVLVGMGAIVMDGAIVGDDIIIGAGSLVPPNKKLESGYLYVGNPVTQKRALIDDEITFLKTSASNYVVLKNDYL